MATLMLGWILRFLLICAYGQTLNTEGLHQKVIQTNQSIALSIKNKKIDKHSVDENYKAVSNFIAVLNTNSPPKHLADVLSFFFNDIELSLISGSEENIQLQNSFFKKLRSVKYVFDSAGISQMLDRVEGHLKKRRNPVYSDKVLSFLLEVPELVTSQDDIYKVRINLITSLYQAGKLETALEKVNIWMGAEKDTDRRYEFLKWKANVAWLSEDLESLKSSHTFLKTFANKKSRIVALDLIECRILILQGNFLGVIAISDKYLNKPIPQVSKLRFVQAKLLALYFSGRSVEFQKLFASIPKLEVGSDSFYRREHLFVTGAKIAADLPANQPLALANCLESTNNPVVWTPYLQLYITGICMPLKDDIRIKSKFEVNYLKKKYVFDLLAKNSPTMRLLNDYVSMSYQNSDQKSLSNLRMTLEKKFKLKFF